MKKLLKIVGLDRMARMGSIAALSLLMVGSSLGNPASSAGAKAPVGEEKAKALVVRIDDLGGMASFRSEQVREDLLRNAFYDASRRAKWLGDYDLTYNPNGKSGVPGSLEINVLNWRRSPTGMYEFTLAANYFDLDGKKVNLGTSFGMRSGLGAFGPWGVGDQFSGSAEDAFRDALRKLEKLAVET